MKRSKYWLIVAVLVIAGGIGWYVFRSKEAAKITYRFEKLDRGEVVVSITATGTLNADTTVQVGTQVSGTIQKLFADFNSEVKKGQLLALLDPTFLQAAVDQQGANKDRAEATVNDAQRTYNRTKDLFAKGLVAQADLDASTTALEQAQAGLRQAQASLHQAEVNLKYATITAPISGVVVSRNVDVGQTVAASLSAPTLFSIANDLRKMQVQASVDEADVGSVRVGQPVSFRVDAYPDETFNGSVRQIRLAPVVTQNVVTYNVIINVSNPDLKLLPGMTATVTIEEARADSALRAPIQATKFTPPASELAALQGRMGAGGRRGERASSGNSTGTQADPPSVEGAERGRMGGAMAATPDSAAGAGERPHWGGQGDRLRLWTIENGNLRPLFVGKGIQNTRYVEIKSDRLKPGDSVIVGIASGAPQSQGQQGTNPFMPRFGGRGR